MKNLFVRFVKDNSGATAIEYGLIAAGISVAIIAVVNTLGTKIHDTFECPEPDEATPSTSPPITWCQTTMLQRLRPQAEAFCFFATARRTH